MLNTKIEWTHHTVNFCWGCSKVSPACENCYAEALDKRYHGGVNWHGQRMPRLEKAREECLKLERHFVTMDGEPVCLSSDVAELELQFHNAKKRIAELESIIEANDSGDNEYNLKNET